jgi:hypothetical protein
VNFIRKPGLFSERIVRGRRLFLSFVFALPECIVEGKFKGKWEKIVSVLCALPWPEASNRGPVRRGEKQDNKILHPLLGFNIGRQGLEFLTILSHRPSAITSGSETTWNHHKFLPSYFGCTLCDALAEADWTRQEFLLFRG